MVGAAAEPPGPPRRPTGHDHHVPTHVLPDDTTSAQVGAPLAPPPASARIAEPAPTNAGELNGDELDGDEDGDETDERTVQQAVPPAIAAAAAAAAAKARAAPPVVPTMASHQPVNGAAPPGKVREAAKTDATDITGDDDDPIEDSITATAPRLNAANLMEAAQSGRGVPIAIPGRVEIRTLEDDDDPQDETEVRTRPGHGGLEVPHALRAGAERPAPRPAAGRPPELARLAADDDPSDEDGITTQAQAPRLGSEPDIDIDTSDELLTRPGLSGESEPPTRPGLEGATDPPTRPGLGGSTNSDHATAKVKVDPNGYPNDQDDDESVTTRARATDPEPYGEDSVTTQAPNVPLELIHAAVKAAEAVNAAALDDTSADTTKKLRKKTRKKDEPSPADEEAESITTQAPGHVTNMLRVIASGSSPDLATGKAKPIEEDEEGPENRTAVMASAPLKRVIQEAESKARLPAIRPTGGPLSHGPMGAAAPRLEPSSESGLRVARSGSGSNERASLGHLLATPDARNSGALLASPQAGGDAASVGPFDPRGLGPDMIQLQQQPSLHDVNLGKGPSYGLLVAIVAVISIVVPVTLFVVLRHGSEPVEAGTPAEPASELEKPGALARGKSARGKNGLTIVPSATVSATAVPAPSSAPSGKPGTKGPPLGRR